jgi:hypothetical protein
MSDLWCTYIPHNSTNTPCSPHVPEIGNTGGKAAFMNFIYNGIIIMGRGGFLPITDLEGPEGSRGIALLLL